MNFVYIVLSYFAGVVSVWVILITQAWTAQKEIEEEPDEPRAQFIDPTPLSDRLKDGTHLNEIIE